MKKVLIGAVRSKGSFKDGKKTVKYDNVKLYLANYREFRDHGFTYDKNVEPVKIRTVDFAEVVGISHQDFLKNFQKKYMFHKVRVIGEENDYGRTDVIEVKISTKDCFELWEELQKDIDEGEVSMPDSYDEDEDSDFDYEEYDSEEEDDDLDEAEESYDFELNEETGEVNEPKKEKKKK